jgi:hypothetical protein
VAGSRSVVVEVIVNGAVQSARSLVADGRTTRIDLEVDIQRSAWVALRILGSLHTQPVFVVVDGRPIRASRRSALWCVACVDFLMKIQLPRIRPSERASADAAYRTARSTFEAIAAESGDV